MLNFTLTDLAEQSIQELQKRGAELTPQDILTIQQLSLDAIHGEGFDGEVSWGKPVCLDDDNWLWPLTIAGSAFYDSVRKIVSERMKLLSLAYACRFGHEQDKMLVRGTDAVKAVRKWSRTLCVTPARVTEVIECLIGDQTPIELTYDDKEERSICLSLTASALVGGSPEMWETACCVDAVVDIIETVVNQKLANGHSAKNDTKILALKNLARFEKVILERTSSNGKK